MKLHKKIESRIDDSIKYILFTDIDNLVVEATFINKHDGKNIICLLTQTSCNMKCKFCHITDISEEVVLRNLLAGEIVEIVKYIYDDLKLHSNKILLVSFMGCGEPLLNVENLTKGIILLNNKYDKIRFAVSTSITIDRNNSFDNFVIAIKENNIKLKLHFSLHYTNDKVRREWMPRTSTIKDSLNKIRYFKEETKNDIEIHYTLINGVNDKDDDIQFLINEFRKTDVCIKFIHYNIKSTIESTCTSIEKVNEIMDILNKNNVKTEYYIPPARDIGGSCGQILIDEYLEHNIK